MNPPTLQYLSELEVTEVTPPAATQPVLPLLLWRRGLGRGGAFSIQESTNPSIHLSRPPAAPESDGGGSFGLRHSRCSPSPIPNLRHVLAVAADVGFVVNEFLVQGLLGVRAASAEARDAVNDVVGEMETVEIVQN